MLPSLVATNYRTQMALLAHIAYDSVYGPEQPEFATNLSNLVSERCVQNTSVEDCSFSQEN